MATARIVKDRPVRYAVVGAGWISQAAFMPGVEHTGNSVMTAVVTGDQEKAQAFAKRYGITKAYHYDAYAAMIAEAEVAVVARYRFSAAGVVA